MTQKNSPIRTGLCAFGMSGRVFHAPFLHCLPQFELAAVVERHQKKAEALYPEVRSYGSIEELLADDTISLVVVNTPNVTHYEYVTAALNAGKDVLVEKPFTATVAQAEALVALAREKQRFLCVYQNRRLDSDFQTVRQVLQQGYLGRLIDIEIHYDRYRPQLNEIKKHKEKPEHGVGLIYDLGAHLVDEAIVLFGKPDAVFAVVQSHRPGSQVDDYMDVKLLYDQFTCSLTSSLLVKEPPAGYTLHGTMGSFIKSRADTQEGELIKGVSPCTPQWGIEPESEWGLLHYMTPEGEQIRKNYPSLPGRYPDFFVQLAAALQEGGPTPVALEDSVLNIRIIEAAIQSSSRREVVRL